MMFVDLYKTVTILIKTTSASTANIIKIYKRDTNR